MRTYRGLSLVVGVLLLTGCRPFFIPGNVSQDSAERQLKNVGYMTFTVTLAVLKADKQKTDAYKQVVAITRETLTGWQADSFVTFWPKIKMVLEIRLPGDENKAVRTLAEGMVKALLNELDRRLNDSPTWKDNTDLVTALTAAFFEGAAEGVEDFGQ